MRHDCFGRWGRLLYRRFTGGGDVRHERSITRRPVSGRVPTRPAGRGPDHRCMKILNFIHVMIARGFYSWAMKEINPMHPDLPRIMQRQRELEDKAQRIFA